MIDDGSTDGTSEMVQKELRNLTIIRGKGNWWWGGALQQGYKWIKNNVKTKNSFVLIINDDTEFDENFLETGICIIGNKTGTIIQAEAFGKRTGKNFGNGVFFDYKNLSFVPAKNETEINCLSTRGLLMHSCDFSRIGDFYPTLLPHYLSDMEYTIRASRKGLKLITNPDFRLIMLEEETGFHEINEDSFITFLKKHYEFKNMMNPLHWIAFVFLVCPFPYNFKNLGLVLKREYYILLGQRIKLKSIR